MARKRPLLYEILGDRERPLGSKPRSESRKPARRPRSRRPARPRGARARPGNGTLAVAGLVVLVLALTAYYVGRLDSGPSTKPQGLFRRVSVEEQGQPESAVETPGYEAPGSAPQSYWTVQVISYPDSEKCREMANEVMDTLVDAGFPDVHGLEAKGSKMIAVAVGRFRTRAMLESLRDEIQRLKIGGEQPFKSAYPRQVELPE